MKHNQEIANAHFHKDWKLRVRTWFDQPKRKQRRRQARAEKAAKAFPRPVSGLLRPEVRCPTVRYQLRVRNGRGFTPSELKAVGISEYEARGIGISVDRRRKNRSEEAFQTNVQRLKVYKSKLTVFPRSKHGKVRTGESAYSELPNTQQNSGVLVPLTAVSHDVEFRKISDAEKKASAYATLRRARGQARGVGRAGKIKEKKPEGKKAE